MSESLRLEAAKKAIQWLKASNLEFAVKMPDGTIEGTLQIAPEKPARTSRKVNDFNKENGYREQMKLMQPGDTLSWDMGERAYAFQKVVAAAGHTFFGHGNYMTELKDNKVTVLRVA